ncbi:MAG: PIN domain-containing protein [Spirochaetaceae bacterium]|nr:PIN domain-containing protein [Spirochaetaceae bacterium]
MTLIDTSAWIEQLRRGGDAAVRRQVEALLGAGEAAWCPLVRLELWNGARGGEERTVLKEMEHTLPSLIIDGAVWDLAATLASRAREGGISVPATDLLVASCARHHEVPLLHRDGHFESVARL